MGGGERYSYNVDRVRNQGTQHNHGEHPGCFGGRSLNDAVNTKRGHQAMVGIVFYGIALFVTIFCIVALFGDGSDEDFYKVRGMSKKARPMWSQDM